MGWRRLFGLGEEGGAASSVRGAADPRAGVRLVPLRTLGAEPVSVLRDGSSSELRLLAPLAPFRPEGTCLVVAGALSIGSPDAAPARGGAVASSPSEAGPRDLLSGRGAPPCRAGSSGAIVLSSSARRADAGPFARIAGETTGEGFRGISGLRVLARTGGLSVLRLGPPPGARWAVTGLHGLVLFAGGLVVIDAGEPLEARAWEAVLVTDPSATLHVVAGNDSLQAVALAAAELDVTLG